MKITINPYVYCREHNACADGLAWIRPFSTLGEAWEKCQRADWMLWLANKCDIAISNQDLRLFACWCVRHTPLANGLTTWDLLTDPRSRNAVEVAERYVVGRVTDDEMSAAASAAADAARAAGAAADAARAAARAAWAAGAAARAAGAAQASQLRSMLGNPFQKA